jgi:hypothetical protein
MSFHIVVLLIVAYTILSTSLFAYWLHLKVVAQLNLKIKHLEELCDILGDDPQGTVVVKTNYGKSSLKPRTDGLKKPYDWRIDETFDTIIDENFPKKEKK